MINVAAYCRVSTERDAQLNSLENQKLFFQQYIHTQPDWALYQIYADEGISGTGTRRRQGFLTMLSEAKQQKFQILLTKEISRFARNTLDSIYYTRLLKQWGVGVIFLTDNINTLDPDAELRLTIMASIAQEESRKTSERVKWGQRRQMEKGTVFGHSLLGYRLLGGRLEVVAEQAEIVRQIFEKFVTEQKGAYTIAKELTAAGVPTPGGGKVWSHSVILKILKNQKYAGDLVQKKTYTPDYLTHKKEINRGAEPLVILKNHHPPIIPPAVFAQAQQLLAQRQNYKKAEQYRYSHAYCFSGKIRCAGCGSHFSARAKQKAGKTYLYWHCYQRTKNRERCAAPILAQPYLEKISQQMMAVLGQQLEKTPSFSRSMEAFYQVLNQALQQEQGENVSARQREELEKTFSLWRQEKERLLELYLKSFLTAEEFHAKNSVYEEKMNVASEKIERLKDGTKNAVVELDEKMAEIKSHCQEVLKGTVFSEGFYREALEEVLVVSKEQMVIYWQGLPYEIHYRA